MKRTLIALMTTVAVTVVAPAAIGSAVPYCPDTDPDCGNASITLSDITPPAGSDVDVSLFGYAGGEDIEVDVSPQGEEPNIGASFRLPRVVVGTVTADADGDAQAVIVAPDAAGVYVVTGTGLSSGAQAQASFTVTTDGTVTPTTTPGGGGGLPATGSDSGQLVQTGAVVLALGVGLVAVAALRRRRTSIA